MNALERLKERLSPHKLALLEHPIYASIDRLEALHGFMERHIFAVWDFMSMLKTLERQFTCTEIPWLPPGDSLSCRLLNEIVLAEESDEDGQGGFASHYELYHRAMTRAGASTAAIDRFLSALREGQPIRSALASPEIPACSRQFVAQTFAILEAGDPCAILSAFTFGREDLLPAVFQRIVDELNVESQGGLDEFKYYLERHIGLDGDEHGPMAHRLLAKLCGDDADRWQSAERAAVSCLEERRKLWDGIHQAIRAG